MSASRAPALISILLLGPLFDSLTLVVVVGAVVVVVAVVVELVVVVDTVTSKSSKHSHIDM